jgi:hypothetical protein
MHLSVISRGRFSFKLVESCKRKRNMRHVEIAKSIKVAVSSQVDLVCPTRTLDCHSCGFRSSFPLSHDLAGKSILPFDNVCIRRLELDFGQ